MTPEAKDLLRSARTTLADVVLPTLSDSFAIEQLRTVLRVLTHLEAVVDEAYPLERETADDLGRVLAEVAATLPRDGELDALRAELERERPVGSEGAPASLDELRRATSRRKRLIAALIRGPLRERRGSEWEGAARPRIADLVGRQLARERRWMAPKPRAAEEKTP